MTVTAAAPAGIQKPPQAARASLLSDAWIMRAGVALLIAWLAISIALPLWALLAKSFQNADGQFVGLANYLRYFSTPALFGSIFNSVWVAVVTTVIVIPL